APRWSPPDRRPPRWTSARTRPCRRRRSGSEPGPDVGAGASAGGRAPRLARECERDRAPARASRRRALALVGRAVLDEAKDAGQLRLAPEAARVGRDGPHEVAHGVAGGQRTAGVVEDERRVEAVARGAPTVLGREPARQERRRVAGVQPGR